MLDAFVPGHPVVEDGGHHDRGQQRRGGARQAARHARSRASGAAGGASSEGDEGRAIGGQDSIACVLPSRGDRVPPLSLHDVCGSSASSPPTSRTRLVALTALPIFFDETGHIRWAIWISQGQKIEKPWQYGKGLPIFVNALLFPWVGEHYLWASRALTVLFGAGTMAGAIALGRALGGRARRAGWPGCFYVACPYALVYDRLVLTDAAMGTFAALVAVLSLRLAERWRGRDAPRSWPPP